MPNEMSFQKSGPSFKAWEFVNESSPDCYIGGSDCDGAVEECTYCNHLCCESHATPHAKNPAWRICESCRPLAKPVQQKDAA